MFRVMCGLLLMSLTATVAIAEPIKLNVVFVTHGDVPIFGDSFDNDKIESFWQQLGTPGPEQNFQVDLDLGDGLQSGLTTSAELATVAIAAFDLTNLVPGAVALMVLDGSVLGDSLALGVASDGAFMFNEGGLLGFLPMDAPGATELIIGYQPDGTTFGIVNNQQVFLGQDSFGPATSVTIIYIPEPATAMTLCLGGLILFGRRVRRASGLRA